MKYVADHFTRKNEVNMGPGFIIRRFTDTNVGLYGTGFVKI